MSSDHEHFRKLERMYHAAPINQFYRPVLTVGEGSAELEIPIRPEFFHAAAAVHGSVYFKALDDAAFFAVNSLVTEVFVPLHGVHQGHNAAIALAAVEAFFDQPLDPDLVAEAFAGVRTPGPFEVLSHEACLRRIDSGAVGPGQTLLASGAPVRQLGSG